MYLSQPPLEKANPQALILSLLSFVPTVEVARLSTFVVSLSFSPSSTLLNISSLTSNVIAVRALLALLLAPSLEGHFPDILNKGEALYSLGQM